MFNQTKMLIHSELQRLVFSGLNICDLQLSNQSIRRAIVYLWADKIIVVDFLTNPDVTRMKILRLQQLFLIST